MIGVDLRYLTYKTGVHWTRELGCKNYYIEPDMIEKGLSALGVHSPLSGSDAKR